MKYKTLKLFQRRRNARKRNQTTNKWTLSIVICLFLFLLIFLNGCSYVCPDKTTIEVGVTETDSKNDKLQEKKSVTQTWKWGKKNCNDR